MKFLLLNFCFLTLSLNILGQTNAVTNGTFDSNLSGWNSGGGWTENSGRAYNHSNGPISAQSLFQTVSNILVTSNTITVTFDYQSQNCIGCGSNPSSTNLDVSFAGTNYLTLQVPTGTANVTANPQSGATINISSFAQATNVSLSLTIPWTGAIPASGVLEFIHRPINGWDDSFLDNVFIASATVMPVKLSSFTGLVEEWGNIINWHTSTEFNTRIFEIEISESGSLFSKIGEVLCKNLSSGASYNFSTSLSGYFRLKIIDFDGYIEYSPVLRLMRVSKSKAVVYPNPMISDNITISLGKAQNMTATLCNLNGQLLRTFKISTASQTLNMEGIPSGLLFLRLSNGDLYKIFKQ